MDKTVGTVAQAMQSRIFSFIVKKSADEVIDRTIYKFPGTSELNFSPNIDNSKVT